jgi:hypothetical protein
LRERVELVVLHERLADSVECADDALERRTLLAEALRALGIRPDVGCF